MSSEYMIDKFRGCLAGVLIGDCMGGPFEWRNHNSRPTDLSDFMRQQLEDTETVKVLEYSDDSAMTKSVAESLIEHKEFVAKDMAKRFTDEFFKAANRGYGIHVSAVFSELKRTNFENPFEPASNQFDGQGSYGNGAAMRTAPVPLFGFHFSDEELVQLVINCAKITHSNRDGYNGAILQTFAIREALKTEPSPTDHSFDVNLFVDSLIEKFKKIESKNLENNGENNSPVDTPFKTVLKTKTTSNNNSFVGKLFLNSLIKKFRKIESKNLDNSGNNSEDQSSVKTSFTDKLIKIKELFGDESKVSELSAKSVAEILGNDVSALGSVSTAIYSVLRAQKAIDTFPTDNPFLRTLFFAISLGGDTDTIASMACSISGALYGSHIIPKALQKHCEDIDVFLKYSDDLYPLSCSFK